MGDAAAATSVTACLFGLPLPLLTGGVGSLGFSASS
jgi:hypothetical protein